MIFALCYGKRKCQNPKYTLTMCKLDHVEFEFSAIAINKKSAPRGFTMIIRIKEICKILSIRTYFYK